MEGQILPCQQLGAGQSRLGAGVKQASVCKTCLRLNFGSVEETFGPTLQLLRLRTNTFPCTTEGCLPGPGDGQPFPPEKEWASPVPVQILFAGGPLTYAGIRSLLQSSVGSQRGAGSGPDQRHPVYIATTGALFVCVCVCTYVHTTALYWMDCSSAVCAVL